MAGRQRVDLDQPRYDQSTYRERARHFFVVTNPFNLFVIPSQLEEARRIVQRYRAGEDVALTEDELWQQKSYYDSAFHPETGELMFIGGRMSTQVPMNLAIIASMLVFYKSTPLTLALQVINQTYMAIVNYTNRSGGKEISTSQLGTAYLGATGGAVSAALVLNSLAKYTPPLVARWVPFGAVAVANCINIPCMRYSEIRDGIPIMNEKGDKLGESKLAAKRAIAQVTVSRIIMCAPAMIVPPIVIQALEKRQWYKSRPWLNVPTQVVLCGIALTVATPLCCAFFPQRASMSAASLEEDVRRQAKLEKTDVVWYNKGL